MTRGSCICGDISYTFLDAPHSKVLCHCLLCRKLTGSAFLTGYTLNDPEQASPGGSDNLAEKKSSSTKGDFAWESKSSSPLKESTGLHESGLTMKFYGCTKCPSTLFKTCKEGFPGVLIVLAGSIDSDDVGINNGTPQAELFVPHRMPWVKEIEGATQCKAFT